MKKCTVVLVTILLLAVTASAATQPPCNREFSIFGDYTHTGDAGGNDAGGGGIGVSQYCDNNISVGLQGWVNLGNSSDITVIGGNVKYHFNPTEEVSPYVGIQANYAMASGTDYSIKSNESTDGMLWGPILGVACKMTNGTSLFVQYEWQMYRGGIRSAGVDESDSIVIGMAWGF